MSAYSATQGDVSTATERQALAPVLVAFCRPAPQSRLTVLVRLFMVIPQLIVLGLLGIAAYVVTIIGWFGALFTGRLPVFAANFLTGYLRWQIRVSAYAALLTGEYPPFSLEDDADYPVRIAVAPGRLNRLAVLFRFFLLIPCAIIQGILSYGAFTIVGFVTWLIVLIKGQMPAALHQALSAVVRFQARTAGFTLMLTSAYPADLFGDPATSGYRAGQGHGAESSWQLTLSDAARKLVAAFIVLGLLIAACVGVVAAVSTGNAVTNASASAALESDITPVRNVINGYSNALSTCKGQLTCVEALDRTVATTLSSFAGQLKGISMPAGKARSDAAALDASVAQTASLFARLGAASSAAQYIKEANAGKLEQSVTAFNQDYLNLSKLLRS